MQLKGLLSFLNSEGVVEDRMTFSVFLPEFKKDRSGNGRPKTPVNKFEGRGRARP
jgi:hypothetical protein